MAHPVPRPAAGMYTPGFAALTSITEFGGGDGAGVDDAAVTAMTVASARVAAIVATAHRFNMHWTEQNRTDIERMGGHAGRA